MSLDPSENPFSKLLDIHSHYIQQASTSTSAPIPIPNISSRIFPRLSNSSDSPPSPSFSAVRIGFSSGLRQPYIPPIDLRAAVSFQELKKSPGTSPEDPFLATSRSLSSSTGDREESPGRKASRLTPRGIFSRRSPREGSHSLNHSLKLSGDGEELANSPKLEGSRLLEGGKANSFNKKLRIYIRRAFRAMTADHVPSPSLTKREVKMGIKQAVDRYLSDEISKTGVYENRSNSPRSQEALKVILRTIKTTGVLTGNLSLRIGKVRDLLLAYFQQVKERTAWAMWLERTVTLLLNRAENLDQFLEAYDTIGDVKITRLFEEILGKEGRDYLKFLRTWTAPQAIDIPLKYYAYINLAYDDVYKITGQKLFFQAETCSSDMKTLSIKFVQDLTFLNSLTIENTPIDISTLREGGESLLHFYVHFLSVYYTMNGMSKDLSEIEIEAEKIYRGDDVPSKQLFWGCVAPWGKFEKKVDILFSSLSPEIKAIPNQDKSSMSIALGSTGYKITKRVVYDCYYYASCEKSSPGFKGSSQGQKLCEVPFYWTMTLADDHAWGQESVKWNGCIQIPETPIAVPDALYKPKWALLNRLIDFSTLSEPTSLKSIPLAENPQDVLSYVSKLTEKLDKASTIPHGEYISWFTLEYFVRNRCRETIIENSSDEWNIPTLAEYVWRGICSDGKILQPMISRLRTFRSELLDYVMEQPYRINLVEDLFTLLDMLISNTNLDVFVGLLENGFKNSEIRQMVLHCMLGGWQQDHLGRDNSQLQQTHITEIMNRLQMVNAGPEFLWGPLTKIADTMKCLDVETISSTPHQWVMTPEKTAAMRKVPFQDVVRSFMQDSVPYFDELDINGISINSKPLEGTKQQKRDSYFTRLLTNIYRDFDPRMTAEAIEKQVSYFTPQGGVFAVITPKEIPCLHLLQLCTVNMVQNGDRFFRYLFSVNDAPLKSNVQQKSICHITIKNSGDYLVEHKKAVGVYPRGIPERIEGGAINQNRLLVNIPFSWIVFPYSEGASEQILGVLQISKDIWHVPTILMEEKYQIFTALYHYNTAFRRTTEWETGNSQAVLTSPLAIPNMRKTGRKRITIKNIHGL